jgi:C-terminal processing protease CtpA/Prc
MRPKLGMSVSDANILNAPVDIGPSGIGIAERAPKVSGISAGPASEGGVHVGDRVFAVDGRSISSAAEFEAVLQGKTVPGEVVLRVGQTRGDAHDVKIVFK